MPRASRFPFRVSVSSVIRLHVALSTAVVALVTVSGTEHATAHYAGTVSYGGERAENISFPSEEYRRAIVNPVPERTDLIDPGNPHNASEARLIVRARSGALNAGRVEDFLQGISHAIRSHYGDALNPSAGVNTPVPIEQAADEVPDQGLFDGREREPVRFAGAETEPHHVGGHLRAAQRDAGFPMIDRNGIRGAQMGGKEADVIHVFDAEREHHGPLRYAAVGGKKAEPIGFPLAVDVVEEALMKRMYSRAGHGN